ncbi:MAG: hypothetical protein NT083_00345 [Rhodocyclales bacterium]|nr:hypothetical protein [Rhodocyclales bacterium]
MKTAIPIPHAILHDPRTSAAALAAVITAVEDDVARRIGLVGDLQSRLGLDFATQRLGMANNRVSIQSSRDQYAAEKENLEITQMTLAGLHTIEAARLALPEPEVAKRAAKQVFDKALGRMVTVGVQQ